MRNPVLLLLVFTAAVAHASRGRRSPFDWTLLPGSNLLRLGDYAKETGVVRSSEVDKTKIPAGRETEDDDDETPPNRPSPGGEQGRPTVPFSFVFDMLQPWWDGPNVCTEKNEVVEDEGSEEDSPFGFGFNFVTTQCSPTRSSYTCTKKIQRNGMRKTVVVRRSCCHGHVRRSDGKPGCQPLEMISVPETLQKLEAKRFLSWIESSDLSSILSEQNVTVFAPTDDAIIDYEDETEDNQISAVNPARRIVDLSPIAKRHVTLGFVDVDHLEDEQMLKTLDGETEIRINKYYTTREVVTANCVPLSGKNSYASNGMVHLVPSVLPRPESTVVEQLESDDFSIFKKMMSETGVLEELFQSEKKDVWTIFAPTNKAFEKMEDSLKRSVLSGEGCLRELVMNHIVKGIVCTAAVPSGERIRVHNSLGSVLKLERSKTSATVNIEGADITKENMLAIDGVLHAVDQLLIPEHAMPLLQSLETIGREDVSDLIREAGLEEDLQGRNNLTLFLPPKYALKSLYINDTLDEESREEARKILLSHMVPITLTTRELVLEQQTVHTLHGHRVHTRPRETLMLGMVTGANVQCVHVQGPQRHACGVVMHHVDKILDSPKGSLLEIVKGMKEHKILARLLKNTDLEKILEEEGEKSYTLLAPNDVAFRRLSEKSLGELMSNQTAAVEVLKMHIVPETVCCNDVLFNPLHHTAFKTLGDNHLRAHRDLYGVVHFGRAVALRCDVPATNGLLHSVSRLLVPERHRTQMHSIFPVDFWPF